MMLTILGVLIVFAQTVLVTLGYRRVPKRAPWKLHGTLGLAIMVVSEILMFKGIEPIATYFNAIVWTGYILFVDALVFRLEGSSYLVNDFKRFVLTLPVVLATYGTFELYNLKAHGWEYRYQVSSEFYRCLLLGWGWTQVIPTMFETARLFKALGWFQFKGPRLAVTPAGLAASYLSGTAVLLIAFVVPRNVLLGALPASFVYFVGLFVGFLFLLEPINYKWRNRGAKSLLRELEAGDWSRLATLAAVGVFCGFFWEFCNYWAAGKWIYVPDAPHLKEYSIFGMPALGYTYYLPFGPECWVIYQFLMGKSLLNPYRD